MLIKYFWTVIFISINFDITLIAFKMSNIIMSKRVIHLFNKKQSLHMSFGTNVKLTSYNVLSSNLGIDYHYNFIKILFKVGLDTIQAVNLSG